ncbi:MAG: hypothetical protein ACI83O_000600 [Patescibacteria group bacterium]|jgi:hypothetical protein
MVTESLRSQERQKISWDNPIVYVIGIIFAILVIILILFLGNNFESDLPEIIAQRNCVASPTASSVLSSACYDAFSKQIYLEVQNNEPLLNDARMTFIFFDYSESSVTFDIPSSGSSSYYSMPAEKNPINAEFYYSSSSVSFCGDILAMPVAYCSADLINSEDSMVTLLSEHSSTNFTFIESPSSSSDAIDLSLVEPEQIWDSICSSSWDCGSWGNCVDGFEKRECVDSSKCVVPSSSISEVRVCSNSCIPDWQCEWSECNGGASFSTCTDLSACGIASDIPSSIACADTCDPVFTCEPWSACNADYDFLTLSHGSFALTGEQSRYCHDDNSCTDSTFETRDCSLAVDVYTENFNACGTSYIGVYNSIDNSLLAKIDQTTDVDVMNLDLSASPISYCDYCSDGIKNFDEERIDCGGSCASCDSRIVVAGYGSGVWDRLQTIFGF